jgi:hypothetical protein
MLKVLGTGAAVLALPPFSSQIRATSSSAEAASPILDGTGARILRAAAAAPSSHNTQPWRVKILDQRHWLLCADEGRWLTVVDPTRRELALSLGTFVENLSVAAGGLGYRVEAEVKARNLTDSDFVEIWLRNSVPTGAPPDRITFRRTLRRGFLPTPLSADVLRRITRELPGVVYFPRGSREATYLAEGTTEAFRTQSHRDDAQSELSRWIRFSSDDIRQHGDGLTPATMELSGFSEWYVRHFMSAESVMERSFREKGIEGTRRQTNEGAGWLVASTQRATPDDLIRVGREYERFLLSLREQDIAAHPMTQMIEEEPWRSTLASELNIDGIPQFIIRIGYVQSYPAPVSPRRPVESFVTSG